MYHFAGNPNQLHANATNSHYSGLLTDTTGPVTGCVGPTSAQEAALRGPIYQYGGDGYGMDFNQPLAGFRQPSISAYNNIGINSSSNLGAAKYYNEPSIIKGGKRFYGKKHRKLMMKGGTGGESNYYGFNGQNEDLSLYAGSGYPPYVKGMECNANTAHSTLIGGKKYRRHTIKRRGAGSKKGGKSIKKGGNKKTHSYGRHYSNKKRHTVKSKSLYKMKGGMSEFSGETGGYSSGGIQLSANESYLANPTIIKPYSTCNGVPRA